MQAGEQKKKLAWRTLNLPSTVAGLTRYGQIIIVLLSIVNGEVQGKGSTGHRKPSRHDFNIRSNQAFIPPTAWGRRW